MFPNLLCFSRKGGVGNKRDRKDRENISMTLRWKRGFVTQGLEQPRLRDWLQVDLKIAYNLRSSIECK